MRTWLLATLCCLMSALCENCTAVESTPPTFNKDVAPIVYRSCAPCHHTGEPAPFNLITYRDVAKRSRQIAEVTKMRYMPPWPPQTGGVYPNFIGSRNLSDTDLALLQRWISSGAIEGDANDLPPVPHWSGEWQLGPPDLVLEMDKAYDLAADGKDVYRNFVIPTPLMDLRYVWAVELKPGSAAVHHASLEVDRSRQSRMKAAVERSPGFPGLMAASSVMPEGQFLAWLPGKKVAVSLPGMPWILNPGTDLVLASHLHPTGRTESIRMKVGFYFTNRPPDRVATRLLVNTELIDIPPGATNFAVENSFTLPVDCDVLAVHPHSHFLGREVEGHAELPDGTTMPLLLITNWDFNWQGDYFFHTPPKLPHGTVLRMKVTYDNSTNNPRNPNIPAARVRYGPETTNEMAELCFLLLPEHSEDAKTLDAARQQFTMQTMALGREQQARENPNDATAQLKLGQTRLSQGRTDEARTQMERAIQLSPDLAPAHYYAGLIARMQNRLPDAEREFEITTRLDPSDAKAWGNMGFVQMALGNIKSAREDLERSLQIDPTLELSRSALNQLPK